MHYLCLWYIKLAGSAIYLDIFHLYFLNSRDCENKYICKGYGIIKNSNRGFYDCFLRNSVANYREIPVGAYLRDTQYKNPDKCKWITRHISTINGCYYTPNNTRGGVYSNNHSII